jgi:hypothetical protein
MKTCGKWSYRLHAPEALSPGKEPPVPTGLEAEGAQSRSGRGSEEKNLYHCRESNSGCPARSLVTVLTELSRLLI